MVLVYTYIRSFFSPSGRRSKPGSSTTGKKRPSSDQVISDSPNEGNGPVTSASESPVFKSKSKRRRVILESDEEEEDEQVTEGGTAVRRESGDEGNCTGGGSGEGDGDEAARSEHNDRTEERMETSASEVEQRKEKEVIT